jgi:hypothetical protein
LPRVQELTPFSREDDDEFSELNFLVGPLNVKMNNSVSVRNENNSQKCNSLVPLNLSKSGSKKSPLFLRGATERKLDKKPSKFQILPEHSCVSK